MGKNLASGLTGLKAVSRRDTKQSCSALPGGERPPVVGERSQERQEAERGREGREAQGRYIQRCTDSSLEGISVLDKNSRKGTSLVVKAKIHAPNAGDLGLIPGQVTRPHRPQLRSCMLQLRPSPAKLIN